VSGARATSIALLLAVSACGTSDHVPTSYEEGEQVILAMHACVPSWIGISRGAPLPAINGTSILAVRMAPSTIDLEQAEIACVLAAGSDCARVRACFGVELFADDRCQFTQSVCEAGVVVSCVAADPGTMQPATRARQDCAHEGGICEPGLTSCSTAGCVSAPACDGNTIVQPCDGGSDIRTECDPDMVCVDTPTPACSGTGQECTSSRCEGDVLQVCDLAHHRHIRAIVCSENGQECRTDALGTRCVARSANCSPSSPAAGCSGRDLTYCGPGGELVTYDCEAHGFGPCEQSRASGTADTRCGPVGRRLF
jgi:hypothetical protein